jgi:hypothetical protein
MKDKKTVYLSHYASFKKLSELSKPRSPLSVLICTDDIPDEWFIDIVEYRTKTKVVTNVSTIIRKDLDDRMSRYLSNGWITLTQL